MFSRRRFLQTLLGGVAGAAVLPYVPKSYFFVGRAAGVPGGISLAAANEVLLKHIQPGVLDNFFKSGPLLAYLREREDQKAWRFHPIPAGTYRPGQAISLATVEDVGRYATP